MQGTKDHIFFGNNYAAVFIALRHSQMI